MMVRYYCQKGRHEKTYPCKTHGVWAAVLLYLMAKGPGVLSIDHEIARRYGVWNQ